MPSVKKNLAYNTAYQILILIVPFITAPYVSRVLGPEGVGTYSVTTAIVKYFWLFAMLGMANYGNRTIAKSKDDKENLSFTFWNLFYFQMIVSSAVSVVYIIYAFVSGTRSYGIVSLCQLPYLLSAVFEVSWFFYGMEAFRGIVIRNTLVKVLTTVAVFSFVRAPSDVWAYALINALSLLAGQLCLWPFVLKYVTWKKPHWKTVWSHFKPNCVLMVSVVAVSIYTLLSKILLEHLSDTVNVGYFENTEKILNIANSVAGAIGAVMLPRVSNLTSRGKSEVVMEYIEKSMRYIMMIAVALCFGIAAVGDHFAVIYFGEAFSACGTLLLAIAPCIVFYAFSNILRNQYLLPSNQDGIFVKATVSAAVLNFLLNLALIPRFGALGAVFGTVGAQFAEFAYQVFQVRKTLPIKKYFCEILPFVGIGAVMFAVCRLIGSQMHASVVALLLQIAAGAAVYIVLCGAYLYRNHDPMIETIRSKIRSSHKKTK